MANSDKNILITPSVGLSTNPTIRFNGANNTPTTLRVLDDGTVSFEGTAGQLFSISDGLTGSIFSVNDISGIPSIEALDTGLVKLNQYGGSTVFGSSAAIQNSSLVNAKVSISTASASTPGLIIKAVSSQTANLQEWQNSAGTVLAKVDASGNATLANVTLGLLVSGSDYRGSYGIGGGGLTTYHGAFAMQSWSTTIVTGVLRAAASQTADLQQWQNSAGTVLAKVDASGQITSTASDHYFGSSAAYRPNIHITNTTGDSNGSYILFEKSKAGSAVVANDVLGVLNFTGFDTATYAGSAMICGVAEGTFSPTSRPGKLVFATVPDGSTTMTDRMTIANSGTVTVNGFGASTVGLIVKSAASQTADLQQWQDSAGSVLGAMNATSMPSGSTLRFSAGFIRSVYFYVGDTIVNTADNASYIKFNSLGTNSSSIQVTNRNATHLPLSVRGFASQTANLQEWQNSSGTVLSNINSAGAANFVRAGIGGTTPGTTPLFVTSPNASYIATIIRAASGQTANLQEWQNSSGTVLSNIRPDGTIAAPYFDNPAASGSYLQAGTSIDIIARVVGQPTLRVIGTASQTANLQQWQNSSGTVLASISSAGKLTSAVDASINGVTVGLGNSSLANTAIGVSALASNTTGINNTAIGNNNLAFNTTGVQNVSLGHYTLYLNTTGQNNTAIGTNALLSNTTGNNNTALGNYAGWNNVFGANNIFIGNNAGYYETGSNKLYIANSSTTTPLIGGDFSANTLTIAGNATITSQATGTVGLIVKAIASQAADLQQWQNSAGGNVLRVTAGGGLLSSNQLTGISESGELATGFTYVKLGTASTFAVAASTQFGALVNIGSGGNAAFVPLAIRGAASQSANLQEWQNSAAVSVAQISATGTISTKPVGFSGNLNTAIISVTDTGSNWSPGNFSFRSDSNGIPRFSFTGPNAANEALTINGGFVGVNTSSPISVFQVTSGSVGHTASIIKGFASQTANLTEWQNSAGTVLAKVDADGGTSFASESVNIRGGSGNFTIRNAGTTAYYTNSSLLVGTGYSAGIGVIIRGNGSQTADLQQWQDSTGNVRAFVNASGDIGTVYGSLQVGNGNAIKDSLATTPNITFGNNTITLWTRNSSYKGFIIQGVASQTADLQQWQNSAGTVLANVTNNGFLNVPAILENPTISATAATGTINYELLTNKSVTYYTSNASANWTLNIRGNSSTTLDSLMAVGQSLTVVFMVTQGSTAYYQSGLQIDGSAVTPKWQGGVTPTFGNASGVDVYSITIMKTASATFTAFESQTRFA